MADIVKDKTEKRRERTTQFLISEGYYGVKFAEGGYSPEVRKDIDRKVKLIARLMREYEASIVQP